MYKLSRETKLPELLDNYVVQVCVGKYQLQFIFSEKSFKISVENKIEVFKDGIVSAWQPGVSIFKLEINTLFDKRVIAYEILAQVNLKIKLENNTYIILYGDDDDHECYQITSNTVDLIV